MIIRALNTHLKSNLSKTPSTFDVEAEDGQSHVQLVLNGLFACVELLPLVDVLATCFTPADNQRGNADHATVTEDRQSMSFNKFNQVNETEISNPSHTLSWDSRYKHVTSTLYWLCLCVENCSYKPVNISKMTGKNIPHIEWSHQSDHILTIFWEFKFGDLRRIKIRRVVFLWIRKQSLELLTCLKVEQTWL